MLQRKLLARLGLLVAGFITGAVVSIVLLQGLLRDLDAMSSDATATIDGVREISTDIDLIEAEAYTGLAATTPGTIDEAVARLQASLDRLAGHPMVHGPGAPGAPAFARVRELLPGFLEQVRAADTPRVPTRDSVGRVAELRRAVVELARTARQQIASEQIALSGHLRSLLIGLTVAALVMVNIAIVVLLRVARMILRPVGELLEASRQLAHEHFDWRVRVDQTDEFAELARAYNLLADQLATNEKRKVEALRLLAVTLNHELNNAINTIGLQLSLLDRRTGGDPTLGAPLRGIRDILARMASTVASLRHVRRIVLTDYGPGEKMLDLPRSVDETEPALAAATRTTPP